MPTWLPLTGPGEAAGEAQPEARCHKEKEKVAEEQAETAKGESGSRPCQVTVRHSTRCL